MENSSYFLVTFKKKNIIKAIRNFEGLNAELEYIVSRKKGTAPNGTISTGYDFDDAPASEILKV